jgi:hypothetical protein
VSVTVASRVTWDELLESVQRGVDDLYVDRGGDLAAGAVAAQLVVFEVP